MMKKNQIRNPHPLIIRHMQAVNGRRLCGWDKSLFLTFSQTDRRVQHILHRLVKGLESKGYKIEAGRNDDLSATNGLHRFDFVVREKLRKSPRPLTAEEERFNYSKKTERYILLPSGIIRAHITANVPQHDTEWVDEEDMPVEKRVPEMLRSVDAAAEYARIANAERKIAEAEARERQRERAERMEAKRKDEERWERFLKLAIEWQSLDVARRFLVAARERHGHRTDVVSNRLPSEWLTWADEQIGKRDPLGEARDVIFSIATLL